MRRILLLGVLLCLLLGMIGCASPQSCDIAATTRPVYDMCRYLCDGTPLQVQRLVTENVSCLHDYTLQVWQMQAISGADAVVLSGAGLEDFLDAPLEGHPCVVDASAGLALTETGHSHEEHSHDDHGHVHSQDPHIWLSPANAAHMATNICTALCEKYPQYQDHFRMNLDDLTQQLAALQRYGEEKLASLTNRELVTFHDGFAYLAEAFDLTILHAIEEESGSEASAKELIQIANIVRDHGLPAVFTETNGSVSAAHIIAAETGAKVYSLDMAMGQRGYLEAMYYNIDTLWEALQ